MAIPAERGISLGPSLAILDDPQPPLIPSQWYWELSVPVNSSSHLGNSNVCHICLKNKQTQAPWADVSFCSSFMNTSPLPLLDELPKPMWDIRGPMSTLKGPLSLDMPWCLIYWCRCQGHWLYKVAITKTTPLPPHVSCPPAVGTNSTLTHVLQGHQKIRCLLYSPNISEEENEPLFPVLDPSFCLQLFSPWGQNSNTFISSLGHSSGPERWFFHSPQFKPGAWPGGRREGEEQLERRALCLSVCPSSWEKGRWCRSHWAGLLAPLLVDF